MSISQHDDPARSVLGLMGECVMSLYGIARLLGSREVGPGKLLPTLVSFASSAREHCRAMGPLYDALSSAAADQPALLSAVHLLEGMGQTVSERVLTAFELDDDVTKLGAKKRLRLEREAERLGAELEGLRSLAEVVHAALHPRIVELSLADLLEGQWQVPPTFVERRVTVRPCASAIDTSLVGEPRVLRLLVARALRELALEGVDRPLAAVSRGERVELELGELDGRSSSSEVVMSLGRALPDEKRIVDYLAEHARVDQGRSAGRTRTLRLFRDPGSRPSSVLTTPTT